MRHWVLQRMKYIKNLWSQSVKDDYVSDLNDKKSSTTENDWVIFHWLRNDARDQMEGASLVSHANLYQL